MNLSGQWAGYLQGMIMTLDTARLRTIEEVGLFAGYGRRGIQSPAGIGALHLFRASAV